MAGSHNVIYEQLDRLERIYAHALPSASPAFNDEGGQGFAGSRGGRNEKVLTSTDTLAAIGWMENAQPYGGALLRALFTGNGVSAYRYSRLYLSKELTERSLEIKARDAGVIVLMAVQEHIGAYSLERCPKCQGRGLVGMPRRGCEVCAGDGVRRQTIKTYTRGRLLNEAGVTISRRRWDKVERAYVALMDGMIEHQNNAAQHLFKVLRR